MRHKNLTRRADLAQAEDERGLRDAQNDLAEVLPVLHPPVGGSDLAEGEDGIHHWGQPAGADQLDDRADLSGSAAP